MSNLGSNNTAVKGQDFELPAGAQLAEDNGDLVVKDSGGTIVFRRNETAGSWEMDGTEVFDGTNITAPVDNESVSTEEAKITDETLIVAECDQQLTGNSGDTFVTPSWGDVLYDERGEFASDTFTPDKAGWYQLHAYATFDSPNDGDRLQAALKNTTQNSFKDFGPVRAVAGTGVSAATFPLTGIFKLEAGDSYTVQVKNRDSSFDISDLTSRLSIRSVYR